jgi:hypothetical protein
MTSTLARCAVLTAAGTTSANFFSTIDSFFRSVVPTVFEVDSTSDQTNLYLEHPDGWWLHIDDNGTVIRCRIAPDGDFSGSQTSPYATVIVSANTATTMHFAEYDDAILIGVKNDTTQSWRQALHAGKIYAPFNASDPGIFLDGLGILGGIPNVTTVLSNVNVGYWINGSSSPFLSNFIRAGFNNWADRFASGFTLTPSSGTLVGNARLVPYLVNFPTATPSYPGPVSQGVTTSPTLVGYLKYIREYPTALSHRTTIPAVGSGDDQSWLVFCEPGNATRRSVCLWSKAVTP